MPKLPAIQYAHAIMQDEIGETALHTASRNGHVNVITVLVQRGADVNSLTKVGGVHSSIVEDAQFKGLHCMWIMEYKLGGASMYNAQLCGQSMQ